MAKPKQAGNGAREKVLDYFTTQWRAAIPERTTDMVDNLLAWLYVEGYIVAPHTVARRARVKKPKPYTGPMTAGETHTARMAR